MRDIFDSITLIVTMNFVVAMVTLFTQISEMLVSQAKHGKKDRATFKVSLTGSVLKTITCNSKKYIFPHLDSRKMCEQ